MSRWSRRRVRPDGRGGYELRLPGPEQALLSSLPGQLDALLSSLEPASLEGQDLPPTLSRLLPPAYLHDDDAEAAYARTTRAELLASRRDDLAVLAKVAQTGAATPEELEATCSALNDLRLVLGTSLEVSEEPAPVDESDPAYPQWLCYSYLSALQTEIVDLLSGALPPPKPGADEEAPEDPWGDPLGGLRWDGTPLPDR